MRIVRLSINNFRGIRQGELLLPDHAVLVGDNNIGKSTVLEAIDLALGPERLARRPPIDEHDFYAGQYIDPKGNICPIEIEVLITDLSQEQIRHFKYHCEWWDSTNCKLLTGPPPEETDRAGVQQAVRVRFEGRYSPDDDDFEGNTYFSSPQKEDGALDVFQRTDKRICGFLYLRTVRTGSRALSLERGSLLDIILQLQGKQLKMWEEVLQQLRVLPVAEKQEIGITDIFSKVEHAVHEFVPPDWTHEPHMRVSDLTRETLRKVLTVFMGTGAKLADGKEYSAPFQHQGTGTINTLVLAMLSMIAEMKQNVIFAMEEPEIAIPPHAQRRIIHSIRSKSAQALFTSHSPYVLGEFSPSQVLIARREDGVFTTVPALLPPAVKPAKYKEEFRRRFCEVLLARRVLITEGRTEYDAIPAAATKLHELNPKEFQPLDSLGIALINAETDSQVAPLCQHFGKLGKAVFAVFDKLSTDAKSAIDATTKYAYEGPCSGFEKTLITGTAETALRRFAKRLTETGEWPSHLAAIAPNPASTLEELRASLLDFLIWAKGQGSAADLLSDCSQDEMPSYIVNTIRQICLEVQKTIKQQFPEDTPSNPEPESTTAA